MMKKMIPLTIILALGLGVSGFHPADAKGPGGGGSPGRPAETGIERGESRANPHGLRGIEKAEAKQAIHKKAKHKKRDRAKGHYKFEGKGRPLPR
jgi:hypothetical protein